MKPHGCLYSRATIVRRGWDDQRAHLDVAELTSLLRFRQSEGGKSSDLTKQIKLRPHLGVQHHISCEHGGDERKPPNGSR